MEQQHKAMKLVNFNGSKSLSKYLEIIKKTPDLPQDLEAKYIREAASNKKAKQALFNAHLKMVFGIARTYSSQRETLEDLIHEGVRGLERALVGFEPKRELKFNTYARFWVKAYILKYFAQNVRSFRVPPEITLKLARINRVNENLSHKLLREPTNEEIADEIGYDKEYVRFLRKYLSPHVHLDSSMTNKEGRVFSTIGESLADNHRGDASESLVRIDDINRIKEALKTLSSKELFVIEHRYGLNKCEQPETLEEVGKQMNLSAERIRQIQDGVEKKLTKLMLK